MYMYIHVCTCTCTLYRNRGPQLPRPQTILRPRCKQLPNAQDVFWPLPGLSSCAGVTGSVGITRHARATQMAGLSSSVTQLCSLRQYSSTQVVEH